MARARGADVRAVEARLYDAGQSPDATGSDWFPIGKGNQEPVFSCLRRRLVPYDVEPLGTRNRSSPTFHASGARATRIRPAKVAQREEDSMSDAAVLQQGASSQPLLSPSIRRQR